MVDMKAKPFYLTDEDCRWVEDSRRDLRAKSYFTGEQ